MKLRYLCLPVSMANLAILIGFGAFSAVQAEPEGSVGSLASTKTSNPSWFKQDKDGILWFQQGDDGQTKYSASLVLSAMRDTIVITVTANEQHVEGALRLAKQMRSVLQKSQHTPNNIPIVVWKDALPGIGYSFYTDGLGVSHKVFGKKGVFKPSDAKRNELLSKVVKQYRILVEQYVPAGEWGESDHKMIALKVVGT